mgnify:CR=1 FL=1
MLIQRLSPTTSELTLRSFLGGFGFGGDRITAEITPFSGGEKARLAVRPSVLMAISMTMRSGYVPGAQSKPTVLRSLWWPVLI